MQDDTEVVGVMIIASSYPYTGNGLGGLPDALEAIVTHEINGQYELYFRYPLTGLHYEELQSGRIVMAKPDDITDAQPFRIYRITKPLNGIVSVYARHLCYDMQGIVVEPFTTDSLTNAFLTIPTKCTPASPITLQTTRTVASGMSISEPRPLWKLLGGQAGSLLDVYGGEWDFDKLDAKLVTQLGQDRGVNIRYGKNLTELEQDATIEASYSGVFPYWYDEETGTLVTLTEKVVAVTGSVVTDRNLVLDCSDDFDTQPTEQQLRDRANAYIAANSVGNLKSSWKVSFVDTEDFIDKVALGDTLHVYYEALGVNATARAVKTEYDVLKVKYKSITVGRVKQNLAAIIVNDKKETDEKIKTTKSFLEQAIDEATYSITHGGGVFREIYDGYDLKEIVSLDNADISLAQSVWRWNNGGFGHSSTGYSGPYTLALLPDGSINATMITTGTLNANIIQAGILQDAAAKNSWDMETGALNITDGTIHITTNSDVEDAIQLSYSYSGYDFLSSMEPFGFIAQQTTNANDTFLTQCTSGSFILRYISNGDDVSSVVADHLGNIACTVYGSGATVIDSGGVKVQDFNPDDTTNDRATLGISGVNLYDSAGNATASFPDGVNFNSDLSVYSARGTINYAVARKWGYFRYINIVFAASYNGTSSTARIIDVGADNTPSYGHALTCIDVTNGSSYVDSSIPCKVGTTGGIYANAMQNGHLYVITGLYFVGSQNA